MLLSLAQAVDGSSLVHTLRDIAIIGALVNVAHLLALSVFAGALVVVDLRFMGAGLTPAPLPFVLAPPAPAEIHCEDDDNQRCNEDHVGQRRHSDGVTGAGIEPAARALKVRCSTTELPSPWCWRRSLLYTPTAFPFTLY